LHSSSLAPIIDQNWRFGTKFAHHGQPGENQPVYITCCNYNYLRYFFFLASIVLKGKDKSRKNRGSEQNLQLSGEEIKMLPETKSTSRAQVKWPVIMNTDEGSADGVITNINNNGAFIRCRKPLRLTETCKLTIESSDREIQDVLAEVVWTNIYGPDDELSPRGMGVRFTGLPEAEEQFLRKLIRMIQEENGVKKVSEIPEIDLDQTAEILH
jgi:hypothetical protein